MSTRVPPAAASGHYTITWTLKNGGWTRYIGTNLAGLYRLVFGMADIKGLNHDFKFIPNKPLQEQTAADATAAAANDQQPLRCVLVCMCASQQLQDSMTFSCSVLAASMVCISDCHCHYGSNSSIVPDLVCRSACRQLQHAARCRTCELQHWM